MEWLASMNFTIDSSFYFRVIVLSFYGIVIKRIDEQVIYYSSKLNSLNFHLL